MTLKTVIALAIGAAIAFPLLAMMGIEVKSLYIVATAGVLLLLTGAVFWRFVRRLFRKK